MKKPYFKLYFYALIKHFIVYPLYIVVYYLYTDILFIYNSIPKLRLVNLKTKILNMAKYVIFFNFNLRSILFKLMLLFTSFNNFSKHHFLTFKTKGFRTKVFIHRFWCYPNAPLLEKKMQFHCFFFSIQALSYLFNLILIRYGNKRYTLSHKLRYKKLIKEKK